jgi:outer membrane protein TolC
MGRALVMAGLLAAAASRAAADERPLTLRLAIQEALASSPRLRAPDDGRALAQIRERQASARFGFKISPTLQTSSEPAGLDQRTLGVAVSRRLPFGADVQFNASAYRYGEAFNQLNDAGYTVGITQPLLRGFGLTATADLEQARRGVETAERSFAAARQQLVVVVAEAYFGVLRADRLIQTAERALDRAGRLQKSSEARAKVGLATELDVLRAELLAAQAEASLVAAREAFESAADALKTLIGRAPDSAFQIAAADLRDVAAELDTLAGPLPDGGAAGLVQAALVSRPEVREARDRIADARRAESVARWNLLPPVTLDVSYTRRGLGPDSSDILGRLLTGWRFNVTTSYAIDRSDESAAAASAALTSRAAARDAIDTERRIAEDVRRADRARSRTAASIDIQAKAVALAERQLRLAEMRYERGVADNFDVIDAESNLFQAQTALVAAEIDRALAALALRRATGTLDPGVFER